MKESTALYPSLECQACVELSHIPMQMQMQEGRGTYPLTRSKNYTRRAINKRTTSEHCPAHTLQRNRTHVHLSLAHDLDRLLRLLAGVERDAQVREDGALGGRDERAGDEPDRPDVCLLRGVCADGVGDGDNLTRTGGLFS